MWRGHRSQVPAWTEAANGLEGAASDLKRDLLAYSHLARRRPRNPHREIPSPWRMEIEVVWPMNKIWFPVCHCGSKIRFRSDHSLKNLLNDPQHMVYRFTKLQSTDSAAFLAGYGLLGLYVISVIHPDNAMEVVEAWFANKVVATDVNPNTANLSMFAAEEHYDRKVLEEAYNWQDRVRSLTGYQDVDWIAAPPMAFVLKNFFYLLRACSPACSFELDQAGSSINAAKMVKTQCLALLSFCPVYWHALL